jgi:HlyD family secretion protein
MKKPVVLGLVILLVAVIAGGGGGQSHQDNGLTLYGNVDIRTVNMSFRRRRLASLALMKAMRLRAGGAG